MKREEEEVHPEYSLRALGSRQGSLHRADGSCQWKQGYTEVLVGVWGPKEAPSRLERVDKTDVQVVVIPATGTPNTHTAAVERHLKKVFQEQILLMLYPRTQIQIVVQILNDDGSMLSACVNATTLALLDAGIPLSSVVVSVDVAVRRDTNYSLILDPNSTQLQENLQALLSFQLGIDQTVVAERSTLPSSQNDSDVYIPKEAYWSAHSLAKKASSKILKFVKLTTSAKCLYECHGTAY